MRLNTLFTLATTVLAVIGAAHAETGLLGEIEFPNSGSEEAQPDFIRGMLYMHNFEYDEASAAFKSAREIDPDFALAYWGEAMTYHHSLWNRQTKSAARDILRKLGRTSEERAAKAPTQREKDLLRAAETLFAMTEETKQLPKEQCDVAYRDVMRGLHTKYPEDNEITALYGLSMLCVASKNREYGSYIRAAAVITQVWDDNRRHPGAAHYLIHSYDDPVHAPLGLPMARAYSEIAPAAAHAQHMTSHIFSALGMWDDLVLANERAVDIEYDAENSDAELTMTAGHYVYWLHYGYLQQGRVEEATELLTMARGLLDHDPTSRERAYYAGMFARQLFDTQDPAVVEQWLVPEGMDVPSPHYHFARAFAAIQAGDAETATHCRDRVQVSGSGNPEVYLDEDIVGVLRKELDALAALEAGDGDTAVALAEEAVQLNAALPFRYGPPQIAKPSGELLGDIFTRLDRHEEAATAYRAQLELMPRRTQSLLGLARAAQASGDTATATQAYQDLATIWHGADGGMTGAKEARANTTD